MRHGDDIRVAAKDRVGARRAVLRLEGELRALGLYMNGEKTRIYSREEYLDWINMHDRQVDAARERRVQTELDAIAENEDLLESALGPERTRELMLDAMYGDGELLQEAIEELRGTIEPEKREVLEQLFLDIFEKRPGQSEALGRVAFDRCLRASMIVLTASKSEFALKYMGQLLTEVPHQTRLFCSYLTSLRAKGKEVAEAVTRAIDACTTEAELGWLVRVLNIVYSHVPGGVVETLRETMRNPHGRWLAAVEIAKLLARRGELKRDELVSLWRACPAMFKPDLVVAAVWMEEHERWAKEWVVGTKSDAIFSEIAKAVRASRQR